MEHLTRSNIDELAHTPDMIKDAYSYLKDTANPLVACMVTPLGQRFLSKLASQVMLFEVDRQYRVRVSSLASSAQALTMPPETTFDESVVTVLKTRLRSVRSDLTDFTSNSSTHFRNEFREN
jgi:hypothetical protein